MLWLGNGAQKFTLLPAPAGPARVFDVADLNGDGRLDLLGLSADGQAQQALNHGSKKYQWQILRPRARVATGDQRINSFGIGGEMELRAGLLVQKQPITSPQLHFGLGEQTSADVVRILWPNGMENAEFALKADQEVLTEQRLKGSCPFLFAWNGKQIGFVKDAVPWGSAHRSANRLGGFSQESRPPKSGTKSAAINSCPTMATTICGSPASYGKPTTTTT